MAEVDAGGDELGEGERFAVGGAEDVDAQTHRMDADAVDAGLEHELVIEQRRLEEVELEVDARQEDAQLPEASPAVAPR